MAGPNDTTPSVGAQGGFTPTPPPDQDTTPDAGADQTDQLGTDADPTDQAAPPEAAGFDPNTSLPTQPAQAAPIDQTTGLPVGMGYVSSHGGGSSYSGVNTGAVAGINQATGLGLLGQSLQGDQSQVTADQATQTADANNQAALDTQAGVDARAVQLEQSNAKLKAQQDQDAALGQLQIQQKQNAAIAAAHAQAVEAKFTQDIAAIQHMEINPTAGQGAAYNTMSGVALFAQGFLSAKYNVNVDAQGVLNSWVDRVTQMQQQQLARGEKLAEADQQMWTMARQDALDRQDELSRAQTLLAARASAQIDMASNMFGGDMAKADASASKAAIAKNLAMGIANASNTAFSHANAIHAQQLGVAEAQIRGATQTRESHYNVGVDQIKAGKPADPIPLYQANLDGTRTQVGMWDPQRVAAGGQNAQKAMDQADFSNTMVPKLVGIAGKYTKNGQILDGALAKLNDDDATVIRAAAGRILADYVGQTKGVRNQEVIEAIKAGIGSDQTKFTRADAQALVRTLNGAANELITSTRDLAGPYVLETPNQKPQAPLGYHTALGAATQVGEDSASATNDKAQTLFSKVYSPQETSSGLVQGVTGVPAVDKNLHDGGPLWQSIAGNTKAPGWERPARDLVNLANTGDPSAIAQVKQAIDLPADDPNWGPERAEYFKAAGVGLNLIQPQGSSVGKPLPAEPASTPDKF